jgi:hypothetical protein
MTEAEMTAWPARELESIGAAEELSDEQVSRIIAILKITNARGGMTWTSASWAPAG